MLLAPPSQQRRADRLLEQARLTATWSGPPSAEAIREGDQRRLLADPILTDEANEEDLALGAKLLEGASPERIAAALVRAYRSRLPEPEDVSDPGTASVPVAEGTYSACCSPAVSAGSYVYNESGYPNSFAAC